MTMLAEDIMEKLPIKTMPNNIGEPTHKSINDLREALYANVAAITTSLGGDFNGQISLLMNVAVYVNMSTTR